MNVKYFAAENMVTSRVGTAHPLSIQPSDTATILHVDKSPYCRGSGHKNAGETGEGK